MKLISRTRQQRMDRFLMEEGGYPLSLLMEMAGLAVFETLEEHFLPPASMGRGARSVIPKIRLFAGSGNNGGDVLVLARHLAAAGWDFRLFAKDPATPDETLQAIATKEDPFDLSTLELQRRILAESGIPLEPFAAYEPSPMGDELIVDGVYGAGFQAARGLRPEAGALFARFAEARALGSTVIAVDLPSGLDAESMAVAKDAVVADATVALEAAHLAVLNDPGQDNAGQVILRSLRVPPSLMSQFWTQESLSGATLYEGLDARLFCTWDHQPNNCSHKGSQGRVLLFAGSERYPGAALLAAGGALHSGAGYVELVAPQSVLRLASLKYPELLVRDRARVSLAELEPDRPGTVVVLGPGMGDPDEAQCWLQPLLKLAPRLILDAGALDALSILFKSSCSEAGCGMRSLRRAELPSPILTPHPGEFRRLFPELAGLSRPEMALRGSALSHSVLLLKGSRTLVADASGASDPNRLLVNLSGNRGLGTAGSGDVLAGVIAAIYAREADPCKAAGMGAFVHGYAADLVAYGATEAASEDGVTQERAGTGPDGLTPSILLEALGEAFAELRREGTQGSLIVTNP